MSLARRRHAVQLFHHDNVVTKTLVTAQLDPHFKITDRVLLPVNIVWHISGTFCFKL